MILSPKKSGMNASELSAETDINLNLDDFEDITRYKAQLT